MQMVKVYSVSPAGVPVSSTSHRSYSLTNLKEPFNGLAISGNTAYVSGKEGGVFSMGWDGSSGFSFCQEYHDWDSKIAAAAASRVKK